MPAHLVGGFVHVPLALGPSRESPVRAEVHELVRVELDIAGVDEPHGRQESAILCGRAPTQGSEAVGASPFMLGGSYRSTDY